MTFSSGFLTEQQFRLHRRRHPVQAAAPSPYLEPLDPGYSLPPLPPTPAQVDLDRRRQPGMHALGAIRNAW